MGDFEREKEGAAETVRLDIVLILLEQLELVAKVSLLDHLRGDLAGIVSIWDGAETAADGPDVFHGVEDALVYGPGHLAEDVERLAHRLKVGLDEIVHSCLEARFNLGHLCLSEVVTTEEKVLPWRRPEDHGQ